MTSIITDEMILSNAISFRNSFLYSPTYICLGRSISWADDSNPPAPEYSASAIKNVWDNIIRGRKIFGTDSTLLVDRYDWEDGEVYPRYSNNIAPGAKFYVLTDDNCVYKVIDNNNNSNSVVKPTGTGLNIIETSDGYKWKFLYQLTADQINRFLIGDYMPIIETNNFTTRGEIYAYDVISSENFLSDPVLTVVGDGSGARIVANITNNKIVSINVISSGFGYTNAKVLVNGIETPGTVIIPIITPVNGHGYNVAKELRANKVGIFCQFPPEASNTETIRQVSCIRSPTIDNIPFNGETMRQTTIIETSVVTNVLVGDNISTGTGSGIVTKVYGNFIEVNNVSGYFVNNQVLLINGNANSSYSISKITRPDCDKNSGDLLYISNILPYARDESQIENHVLVISM